jgi:hypothetical protein
MGPVRKPNLSCPLRAANVQQGVAKAVVHPIEPVYSERAPSGPRSEEGSGDSMGPRGDGPLRRPSPGSGSTAGYRRGFTTTRARMDGWIMQM